MSKEIVYEGFYLTNDLYGGYSFRESPTLSGSADYTNPEEVLRLAKESGAKEIHLAGDSWKRIGRKGWGEVVSIEEAERLLKALKQKRENEEWHGAYGHSIHSIPDETNYV